MTGLFMRQPGAALFSRRSAPVGCFRPPPPSRRHCRRPAGGSGNRARPTGRCAAPRRPIGVVTLTLDLEQPWGMAFLPDGRLLITERPGRLRMFANNRLERARAGRRRAHGRAARGQGGLLDVCLHPALRRRTALLYLDLLRPRAKAARRRVLARAEVRDGGGLRSVRPIFRSLAAHFRRPAFRLAHRVRPCRG